MAASRSIKIKWASSHYVFGRHDGVRVRFDTVCADGMPTKVFAYRMLPVSPQTGKQVGHFSHICSPPDLAEYPEDGPTPGFSPEWFRLSYVDVFIRSVEEAEDFISIVRGDVRRLKRTLDTMDTVFPGGEEQLGDICDPVILSSSSSSSGSSEGVSLGSLAAITAIGTGEQFVGAGVPWVNIGTGAGSQIGSSDSLALNRSRVELCARESSQLLLVQGFDFSELADDAIIEGLVARLVLRDATNEAPSSSSSLSSTSSLSGGAPQCPRLIFLSLQHADFGLSNNKATGDCIDGPAWQDLSFGGAGDLWGYAGVDGRDLKRGEFGLGLVVGNDGIPPFVAAEVDGVELTAFYREVI